VPRGTYTLVVELDGPTEVAFGAAGERELGAGALAYTGSAFGSGGLEARVERHLELARGDREARHWHVDHLLGRPEARVRGVAMAPGVRAECEVADRVPADPVEGLGASDCSCPTHVHAAEDAGELARVYRRYR